MAKSYEKKFVCDLLAKCKEGIVECRIRSEKEELTHDFWNSVQDLLEYLAEHFYGAHEELYEYHELDDEMIRIHNQTFYKKFNCGDPDCDVCPI